MQQFRFKQFTITQNNTLFKVGTDSCILGAWAPVSGQKGRCADLGTGTGLLALMMAQRTEFLIDAYEISDDACVLAQQNFSNSPWEHRIRLHTTNYFELQNQHLGYDCIIANPPYFVNALPNPVAHKTTARHFDTQQATEFTSVISNNLVDSGVFFTVLPIQTAQFMIPLFQQAKLNPFVCLHVQSTPQKSEHLWVLGFSFNNQTCAHQSLVVYDPHAPIRSHQYAKLLEDFYV